MVSKTLASLALMAGAASAGSFTVQNSCDSTTLYYWVVEAAQNGVQAGTTQGPFTVSPGQSGDPQSYIQLASGGVAVKFNTVEDIDGSQLFEYSYYGDSQQNWFDLSDITGDPFVEGGFMLIPSEISAGNCHGITCCAGTSSCPVVYNVWNDDTKSGPDNPMANCLGSVDLTLVVCPNKAQSAVQQTYEGACPANPGQGGGSAPSQSSSAAAPPPSPTTFAQAQKPAPSVTISSATLLAEESAAPYAVEVVTEVTTITEFGKRSEATPAPEHIKRHLHRHAHAHGSH